MRGLSLSSAGLAAGMAEDLRQLGPASKSRGPRANRVAPRDKSKSILSPFDVIPSRYTNRA